MMAVAATWMDLEIITLSEVSQIDKYQVVSVKCGVQKMIQMSLFTKQKQTHRHRKQTYGYQKGKGGINQELEINRYTLLYIKQTNNKVLLYSTGNYIQYCVII